MSSYILLIEDEASIHEMLDLALTKAGFTLEHAINVTEAKNIIFNRLPELILLDWMLPGMSGIEFAKQLKKDQSTQEIPFIMLTARGEEADKIRGLEIGADDYVTKPFSPRELIARIKAVLRRASSTHERLQIKNLILDLVEHRIMVDDKELKMGTTEFRLLQFFMQHPERVYSRSQVLDHVWGTNVYIDERTVDVHILRLRKALAPYKYDKLVQTVRGVGYRFSEKTEL
ncbi:phosphate regulon transcriptional regulator PhoB [Candidatus Marithrix sp. Canyon 246]|uniref:phosphate regulon transcriptional regulator PhoB n=1 Tax=Candidatus Marithrix sp. Canyon 246 TaxID=1827136 RepID=UPI00084A1F9C|nr:phosphate regulon transcriptional regulator PhoB [Candidatus Marithrix sp. Canyon 246]